MTATYSTGEVPAVGDTVECVRGRDEDHPSPLRIGQRFSVLEVGAGIIVKRCYGNSLAKYRVDPRNYTLIRRSGEKGDGGNG